MSIKSIKKKALSHQSVDFFAPSKVVHPSGLNKGDMKKRMLKKSDVLREGYVKGLKHAQRIINEAIGSFDKSWPFRRITKEEMVQIAFDIVRENYQREDTTIPDWDAVDFMGRCWEEFIDEMANEYNMGRPAAVKGWYLIDDELTDMIAKRLGFKFKYPYNPYK